MTLTIDLAPDVEKRLQKKAARHGQSVAEYVQIRAEREAQQGEEEAATPGKSLAEMLAGRIGLFESGGQNLSENCGETFAGYLEAKRKQGR